MKKLLFILFLFSKAFGQTTPLSFTKIPFANPEFIGPGRGAEDWYDGQGINIPTPTSGDSAVDMYWRFTWEDVQTQATGAFTFAKFDNQLQIAVDHGCKFNFGIFAFNPTGGPTVGGSTLNYPNSVHAAMQAEPVYKDNRDTAPAYPGYNSWVPNWNAPSFRTAYNKLMDTIIAHLKATTYKGFTEYQEVGYVDIRTYGNTGEWTGYNLATNPSYMPTNSVVTDSCLLNFVNDMLAKWPDKQLQVCIGAILGTTVSDAVGSPAVGYYVFNATNSIGHIGLRRDCLGQTDAFVHTFLENNSTVYLGFHFDSAIMNRYKVAPFNGEPCSCCMVAGDPLNQGISYWDLPNQINLYHHTSFGNGNFFFNGDVTHQNQGIDSVAKASKNAGYRLVLDTGNCTTAPVTGGTFNITLDWKNVGIAPVYEKWNVIFELRNLSTVVWRDTSLFHPRLFLPSASDSVVTDHYTFSGVAAGTYNLYMIIKDPAGYRLPMPIAITGKNTDGSYLLRAAVTISSSGAPVAFAGNDQTITLPTSSVTLDGTGSSGTITSYAWSKVSGPNTPTIVSATSSTTSVTGLIAGTYVFQLSVNGGTSTDNISILVNPATPPSVNIFTTQTPVAATDNDHQGTVGQELGLRFKSTINGFITGIRFYKTSGNSGTHIGELYSNTGTRLAQATFTGETATGWQSVTFATPVAITAGTLYVAAYFSSLGNYVEDNNYFNGNTVTNTQLVAPADGLSGTDGSANVADNGTGNGPFKYSATPTFPNVVFASANYWVDVIFSIPPPNVITHPRASHLYFQGP